MQEGVEGLLRYETRPSRIPALPLEIVVWVATRTREAPPGETTHWTVSLMAREAGISASSVPLRRELDLEFAAQILPLEFLVLADTG